MRPLTKEDLEQLRALPAEIKVIQDSIDNLPVVTDSVTGSRPHIPFDKHTITIEGIDAKRVRILRRRLKLKCEELQDRIEEMEGWLDGIEDSEIRTILRLRYRNGLTDTQIGDEIGYSRSSVSMKLSRFFRK